MLSKLRIVFRVMFDEETIRKPAEELELVMRASKMYVNISHAWLLNYRLYVNRSRGSWIAGFRSAIKRVRFFSHAWSLDFCAHTHFVNTMLSKGEITGRVHCNIRWKPEVSIHDDELLQVCFHIIRNLPTMHD